MDLSQAIHRLSARQRRAPCDYRGHCGPDRRSWIRLASTARTLVLWRSTSVDRGATVSSPLLLPPTLRARRPQSAARLRLDRSSCVAAISALDGRPSADPIFTAGGRPGRQSAGLPPLELEASARRLAVVSAEGFHQSCDLVVALVWHSHFYGDDKVARMVGPRDPLPA